MPSRQSTGRGPAPPPVLPDRRRTSFGPKSVGSFVPRLTRSAFEKYGFSAATLLTDWASIVGSEVAAYTAPERMKWPRRVGQGEAADSGQGRPGATLILRVDGSRALEVQYRGVQILDRINAYFGYRAVQEMRIIQGPVAAVPTAITAREALARPAPPPPLAVAAIADEALRHALSRMAAGLSARRGA